MAAEGKRSLAPPLPPLEFFLEPGFDGVGGQWPQQYLLPLAPPPFQLPPPPHRARASCPNTAAKPGLLHQDKRSEGGGNEGEIELTLAEEEVQ